MKALDVTDRHILALLQDNARLPLVAIAEAVGLSRSATQERLRRLEQAGVIEKYTVRLGGRERPRIQAWLAITLAPGRTCAQVVPALKPFPELRLLQSLAGPIDLLALAETDSVADLTTLRERLATTPGVAKVETALVLETHLDRT